MTAPEHAADVRSTSKRSSPSEQTDLAATLDSRPCASALGDAGRYPGQSGIRMTFQGLPGPNSTLTLLDGGSYTLIVAVGFLILYPSAKPSSSQLMRVAILRLGVACIQRRDVAVQHGDGGRLFLGHVASSCCWGGITDHATVGALLWARVIAASRSLVAMTGGTGIGGTAVSRKRKRPLSR